jgi:C-terminal processing protease CtpA/Prc
MTRLLLTVLFTGLLALTQNGHATDTATDPKLNWIGVGVWVQFVNNQPTVTTRKQPTIITVFPNSPAQQAGVHVGDVITQVDDTKVHGLKLGEILKLLHGDLGTKVKVIVTRSGEKDPLTFSLRREPIHIDKAPTAPKTSD